jgi:IS605 OrfB family transposase
LETTLRFNEAANWVSEVAFTSKNFNKVNLQKQLYYQVKEKFGLGSQMAILAIRKAADSYKNFKTRATRHVFRELGSVDYDSRNLTIKDGVVSITTLTGREKIHYFSKDKIEKLGSQCELTFDKVKNKFYLNVIVEKKELETYETGEYLGVDFGIVNLATCSDGETFSGKAVEKYRRKITKLKAALQSKHTKSSKRHLKKISKKEHRYKKDINHCISKKLVMKAKALGVGLKLEELKNIRKKPVKSFNKQQRNNNAMLGKWAFFQLRTFTEYKAKMAGVPVKLVNPAYTSQMCSKCGYTDKGNRVSQADFKCLSCGYSTNADVNAAINISRGSSITLLLSDVGLEKSGLTVAVATKV